MLKRTLTEVVCAYHDVQSLGELNTAAVGSETADEPESPTANSGFTLDEDITPLVGESDVEREQQTDPLATPDSTSDQPVDETTTTATTESNATESSVATETDHEQGTTTQESPRDESHLKTVEQRNESVGTESASQAQSTPSQPVSESAIDPAEFKQLQEQVATLTTAVQRQNDLLRQQHETIQRLLEQRE